MEYVKLGSTGLRVSRICLGMMTYGTSKWRDWVLDEDDARPFVRRALDLGITFFDTADVYSLGVSEEVTGRALKDMAQRDKIVIATKVCNPMSGDPNDRGLSRKHIMQSIDASLKRLGTDYVDLYQVHRWDPGTPIEETMEALNDIVRAGKALYIGASSMYAWQFAKAQRVAQEKIWSRFVSMQNHYNLVYREEEREMIPQCRDQGVGIIPWSPLARGFLAGNRSATKQDETARSRSDDFAHSLYYQESDFQVVDAVSQVAAERGVKPAQVALAWMLGKPYVTAPIVGASKVYQLEEAVAATELRLTEDEVKAVETPYVPHRVLGHG
ncbi:MAG: aldo/keto reductase [Dehalococcoidia bacterium]|nr:aldo/keto reductase [Dehalococcoidia bacterium]